MCRQFMNKDNNYVKIFALNRYLIKNFLKRYSQSKSEMENEQYNILIVLMNKIKIKIYHKI